MRLFHLYYDGIRHPVFASNYIAARRLGICALVKQLHIIDLDKVAIVDPEIACALGSYHDVRDAAL